MIFLLNEFKDISGMVFTHLFAILLVELWGYCYGFSKTFMVVHLPRCYNPTWNSSQVAWDLGSSPKSMIWRSKWSSLTHLSPIILRSMNNSWIWPPDPLKLQLKVSWAMSPMN